MRGQADADVPREVRIRVEEVDLRPDAPDLSLQTGRLTPGETAAGDLRSEEHHQLVPHAKRRVGEEERAVGTERVDAIEKCADLALHDLPRRRRLRLDVE